MSKLKPTRPAVAMKFKPEEILFLYSMGKCFRVTAIFSDMAAANRHMERNTNAACIAAFGNEDDKRGELVFIADKYDPGQKAPRPEPTPKEQTA